MLTEYNKICQECPVAMENFRLKFFLKVIESRKFVYLEISSDLYSYRLQYISYNLNLVKIDYEAGLKLWDEYCYILNKKFWLFQNFRCVSKCVSKLMLADGDMDHIIWTISYGRLLSVSPWHNSFFIKHLFGYRQLKWPTHSDKKSEILAEFISSRVYF